MLEEDEVLHLKFVSFQPVTGITGDRFPFLCLAPGCNFLLAGQFLYFPLVLHLTLSAFCSGALRSIQPRLLLVEFVNLQEIMSWTSLVTSHQNPISVVQIRRKMWIREGRFCAQIFQFFLFCLSSYIKLFIRAEL